MKKLVIREIRDLKYPLLSCCWAISLTAMAGVEVNVKDYGAVMDGVTDDTSAVLAAFAAAGDKGKVYFPAGTAVMTQPIVLSNRSVTVTGEDVSNTRILWNAPGGFDVRLRINDLCAISDLQLIAGCADAGTAIRLVSDPRAQRALNAMNLKIIRTDGSYWNKSIHLTLGVLSRLKNITMSGLYPHTTCHLQLDGFSTAVQMSELTATGSEYGVYWEGDGEGNIIHDSLFADNDYGLVRTDPDYNEPLYDLQNCIVTSRVSCLVFNNRRNTGIHNNRFVREGSSNEPCIDLYGSIALSVNFTDNLIKNAGSGSGPGIRVTDGRQMNFVNNTIDGFDTGMLIDGNSRLINIGDTFTNCTTEVELGASVSDIYRR